MVKASVVNAPAFIMVTYRWDTGRLLHIPVRAKDQRVSGNAIDYRSPEAEAFTTRVQAAVVTDGADAVRDWLMQQTPATPADALNLEP